MEREPRISHDRNRLVHAGGRSREHTSEPQIAPAAGGESPEAGSVVGAFSEEQASRLTGVSLRQLGYWHRIGFFRAKSVQDEPRAPFRRIYSFHDLATLRVLNNLRNEHRVPMGHLREVAAEFAALGAGGWASRTLFVLNRRVVWKSPVSGQREEVVGCQRVFEIPLRLVASGLRAAIKALNVRSDDQVGRVVRGRFVEQNQPVLAGTRIPVAVIRDFARAGYSQALILREYPALEPADVRAALAYEGVGAAA